MRRRAEVVVVVLILLVVGGLVTVFVNKVRDAACRIQCQNNLKQLGCSVQDYYSFYGYYPPGTVDNPVLPPDRRLSWHIDLYGFMIGGEKLLLDEALPWDAEENWDPKYLVSKDHDRVEVIGQLGWLTCSSNPNRAASGAPGSTHYVGIAGIGDDAAFLPVGDKRAGFFGYDWKTCLDDIKDGTSTTLLVVETARDNGPWTKGGRATVRGLGPDQGPYLGRDGQFGSRHHGAVTNVVFVDASVKFVRVEMAPGVFEALATIAGGEEVGDY